MTQTQTEPETYKPVRVHIASSDIPQPAAPARRRYGCRATYTTITLTANDPAQDILPQDDDRECAYVQALDNDIVIGPTKGIAAASANTTTGANPDGTVIPKANTVPYPVLDTGPVFAGVTTTASNSRVSVTAYYRVRE